jgi:hypothetical protein
MASFALPLHRGAYGIGPFVRNPLVTSEYRPTAEYEYLYTPALAAYSPPQPSSYRYSADNSYLLRPGLGRSAVALAYRWRYCMQTGLAQAPRARSRQLGAGGGPAVERKHGQKIDGALSPSILAGTGSALEGVGASGPRLDLADALPQPGWGSADTHRPCVTVR